MNDKNNNIKVAWDVTIRKGYEKYNATMKIYRLPCYYTLFDSVLANKNEFVFLLFLFALRCHHHINSLYNK